MRLVELIDTTDKIVDKYFNEDNISFNNIEQIEFANCKFENVVFENSSLLNVNFMKCEFNFCVFDNVSIKNVNFYNSKIVNLSLMIVKFLM